MEKLNEDYNLRPCKRELKFGTGTLRVYDDRPRGLAEIVFKSSYGEYSTKISGFNLDYWIPAAFYSIFNKMLEDHPYSDNIIPLSAAKGFFEVAIEKQEDVKNAIIYAIKDSWDSHQEFLKKEAMKESEVAVFDSILRESAGPNLEMFLDRAFVEEYRMISRNTAEVRVRKTPEPLDSAKMAARFEDDIPEGYELKVKYLGPDSILGKGWDTYEVSLEGGALKESKKLKESEEDDAWEKGYELYEPDQDPAKHNPYNPTGRLAKYFMEGWNAAKRDNE